MRRTPGTALLILGVALAVGCGNSDIAADMGGAGADALDDGDLIVQTACEEIDEAETCDATEGCQWLAMVLEMYPPQIVEGCFPIDGGGADGDCSVVSSDGTVVEVPCDEPGDPGSVPGSPGDDPGADPEEPGTEPGEPADDEGGSIQPDDPGVSGGVVTGCEAIEEAEACDATEGCQWLAMVLEMYPPQIVEGCFPIDGGGADGDCSVVSSDGTVTVVPCEEPGDSGTEPGGTGGSSSDFDPSQP